MKHEISHKVTNEKTINGRYVKVIVTDDSVMSTTNNDSWLDLSDRKSARALAQMILEAIIEFESKDPILEPNLQSTIN